jgi:SAM-dependent methyltransferase
MHPEALAGYAKMIELAKKSFGFDPAAPTTALDVGAFNVNGSARHLIPGAQWVGLDIRPGPDVEIVGDATQHIEPPIYDIVSSTELFEHAMHWRSIIANMRKALRPGGAGLFFATCASIKRRVHSASGADELEPGEWYKNIHHETMLAALKANFDHAWVDYNKDPGDIYMMAKVRWR